MWAKWSMKSPSCLLLFYSTIPPSPSPTLRKIIYYWTFLKYQLCRKTYVSQWKCSIITKWEGKKLWNLIAPYQDPSQKTASMTSNILKNYPIINRNVFLNIFTGIARKILCSKSRNVIEMSKLEWISAERWLNECSDRSIGIWFNSSTVEYFNAYVSISNASLNMNCVL